jgi:membrane-anchored glycerophosphoryl diester phosphodiesterase (GDPDase)
MITTVFVNTNLLQHRLATVATTIILFYAMVLVHQFGIDGISSNELVAGFDASGCALTLVVVLLIVLVIGFLHKKYLMEQKAK